MPKTRLLTATAALVAVLAAAPALADANSQFVIADIRSKTPSCRDNPDAPWIGRVSGILGGFPSRGAAFVGCFQTREACERWRGPVSGVFTARLTLNTCSPRGTR